MKMSLNMKEKMLKNFIENNLNDIYGISYAALYPAAYQFVDIGIINRFKFMDLGLETKTSYFGFFLSKVEIFDLDNSA